MNDSISDAVRQGYSAVARQGLGSDQDGVRSIATAFGYSEEELGSIPDQANMGLSCGNPLALASLREGETVVDLGAGGGLDVFLASRRVGASGRAIGVDMTGDMVSLARANARRGGYDNVRFYLAEIEAMPIPSGSVDCVISNCVLNLCEDKDAALAEVYRILKPGGRLAVSDLALKQPLPEQVAEQVAAWIGCIGGAITVEENRQKLLAAGFSEVAIEDTHADLNVYKEAGSAACCAPSEPADSASCCSPAAPAANPPAAEPAFHDEMRALLESVDANTYAASVRIFAVKPG
jgi:SAM-dependent methyltransferase